MSLTVSIKQAARDVGFDTVGIARVAPSDHETFLTRLLGWLERGYHGTMAWMAKHPAKRADPAQVLSGCRSIIAVGANYLTEHRAEERPGHGRIARYAWGRDYHDVLSERLRELERRIIALAPEASTRSYVDTGPVMEKAWAERAGVGWIGKHSNLVSAQFGSWLLLGEVLTTLELEPDEPATDLCGSCRLCIQACPTGAIVEPYVVDATRCVSYLTIEYRGRRDDIPPDLQRGMGNKIFGCDDCLDVCPFNLQATASLDTAFQPHPDTLAPDLAALSRLDTASFADRFRGSPIQRAKHEGFQRNLSIASDNRQPFSPRSLVGQSHGPFPSPHQEE